MKISKEEFMETLYKICLTLIIIGAINWGLVGLFDFNLVTAIFGVDSIISNVLYVLIAISGLVSIGLLFIHYEVE